MKRFYLAARATADGAIELDGKPVRTPARNFLVLPTPALADAVADEWNAQGDKVDPRAMALTGLANAAIDRIAPDPDAFARGLAAYGQSDLLCYRAEGPVRLVERQAAHWDPILAWARRRYDVDFEVTSGLVHRPQPPATVERLTHEVLARPPSSSPLWRRWSVFRARCWSLWRWPRARSISTPPGPPPRSTSIGTPSNGARMPTRPPRSPPAAASSATPGAS